MISYLLPLLIICSTDIVNPNRATWYITSPIDWHYNRETNTTEAKATLLYLGGDGTALEICGKSINKSNNKITVNFYTYHEEILIAKGSWKLDKDGNLVLKLRCTYWCGKILPWVGQDYQVDVKKVWMAKPRGRNNRIIDYQRDGVKFVACSELVESEKILQEIGKFRSRVPASAVQIPFEEAEKNLLTKCSPLFPPEAVKGGEEERFLIYVNQEGIASLRLFWVSDSRLIEPANDAIKQWRFNPFVIDGKISEICTVWKVSFPTENK
ncbi:MAG: hypothetical protein KA419_19580 [Acidobacteria bacterium]|nr:hypothetical protein [Acidobacteriota bacterium]